MKQVIDKKVNLYIDFGVKYYINMFLQLIHILLIPLILIGYETTL